MASKKQIEANQRNAKNSTGPKTVAGKASSKMNALKHGLTAETVVIRGEDPEEFDEMREELVREFAPRTALACQLVDRLAALLWRLRRVTVFEAAIVEYQCLEAVRDDFREIIDKHTLMPEVKSHISHGMSDGSEEYNAAEQQLAATKDQCDVPAAMLARAFIRASSNADILGKLSRYELGIVKMIKTTLEQLERRKTRTEQNQIADPKIIELKAQGDDS